MQKLSHSPPLSLFLQRHSGNRSVSQHSLSVGRLIDRSIMNRCISGTPSVSQSVSKEGRKSKRLTVGFEAFLRSSYVAGHPCGSPMAAGVPSGFPVFFPARSPVDRVSLRPAKRAGSKKTNERASKQARNYLERVSEPTADEPIGLRSHVCLLESLELRETPPYMGKFPACFWNEATRVS